MKFLFSITITFITISLFGQSHPDYGALKALYESTNGVNWFNKSGWVAGVLDPESDPCDGWHGISCNEANRVDNIRLTFNNLNGSLPESIGEMTMLEILDLTGNKLGGALPESLADLQLLRRLFMDFNDYAGELPAFLGSCQSLQDLSFALNDLSGELPEEIGNLQELGVLVLVGNNLSGEVFDVIVNLKKLRILSLRNNNFEGEIPQNITDVPFLRSIGLNSNNFTGEIPPSWGDVSDYLNFDISDNNFSGCIPTGFLSYCDTDDVKFGNNPLLPYEGEFEDFCMNNAESIGAPCDDGDDSNGIDDVIKEDCSCGPKPLNTENIIEGIQVYPNPTSNALFLDGIKRSNWSYELINLIGQRVTRMRLPEDGRIEMSNYAEGVYILKLINTTSDQLQTFKIVKQ